MELEQTCDTVRLAETNFIKYSSLDFCSHLLDTHPHAFWWSIFDSHILTNCTYGIWWGEAEYRLPIEALKNLLFCDETKNPFF